MALKTVTVIDHTGAARNFRAEKFDIDENGYLKLTDSEGTVVARFSPASWHGVYGAEAVA